MKTPKENITVISRKDGIEDIKDSGRTSAIYSGYGATGFSGYSGYSGSWNIKETIKIIKKLDLDKIFDYSVDMLVTERNSFIIIKLISKNDKMSYSIEINQGGNFFDAEELKEKIFLQIKKFIRNFNLSKIL